MSPFLCPSPIFDFNDVLWHNGLERAMDERVINLQTALGSFLAEGLVCQQMALILTQAVDNGTVCYEEIEQVAANDVEDVLLLGFEWRLLLPVRAIRCGEWDDRLLQPEAGEVYELPNIVRWLVTDARKTAEWHPHRAIGDLFRTMREPSWARMPVLVEKLMNASRHCRISALRIKDVCSNLGLGDRVDGLIAELKGSGVMSPRLGPLAELATTRGGPQYELNRCLFVNGKGHRPTGMKK